MKRQTFEMGQTIFREGEPSVVAYLIVSGEVEILGSTDGGPPKAIAVLGKGEYVGEMGAIDDHPRSATARAKSQVVCMSVDQAEFMDMLLNEPKESIELLKVLFERLRHANRRLLELENSDDD